MEPLLAIDNSNVNRRDLVIMKKCKNKHIKVRIKYLKQNM